MKIEVAATLHQSNAVSEEQIETTLYTNNRAMMANAGAVGGTVADDDFDQGGISNDMNFKESQQLSFFQKRIVMTKESIAKKLIGAEVITIQKAVEINLLLADVTLKTQNSLMAIPPTALLNTYNAVVSCGVADLPTAPQYTFGLIDISSAIPASGRVETTSSAPHFVHSSWHLDSLGNVFGTAINNITGDIFAAASCNYQAQFFDFNSIYKYGSIGGGGSSGGADNVTAAGTVYKMDAITGKASVFVQLPQQSILLRHSACEDEDLIVDRPNHGVGLGNITFDSFREQLFIVNWEDGRIYRVDNGGNILDAYDPGNTDDGTPGVTANDLLPYGIAINNDGTKLFYGTMERELYSIDLSPTGGFLGTSSASGLGYDYYEDATETLHTTLPDNSGGGSIQNFTVISDLEFLPDGGLLVGIRSTCRGVGPPPISTHPNFSIVAAWNHNGTSHLVLDNGSGQYNNVSAHMNITYDSNHIDGEADDYGGVSYRENLDGSIDYIVSSSDLINALGPHGIALFSELNATSTGLISPMGAVGYTNTAVDNQDPKGIGGDVQVFNALPVPCSDLTLQADNCDFDGDSVNNEDDLDDDNDGILDKEEMTCTTQGNGASATETGGAGNINLATGTISAAGTPADGTNSADIRGGDILTLTLDSEVPTGTIITLSMAERTAGGQVTITDEGTGSLIVGAGDWTTEDVLQYFSFVITTPTDVLVFTRNSNTVWIDGVSYCTTYTDLDTDTDGIDNRFDLDSDGDGCYDKYEAGVITSAPNGAITDSLAATSAADVGANGFANTLETTEDGIYTGTYTYALATDMVSACPVCFAGTVAPPLSGSFIENLCPTATADAASLHAGTAPSGTTLVWSTDGNPTDGLTSVESSPLSTAGTYYAYYEDAVNACYSQASNAVKVVIAACAPSASAPVITSDCIVAFQENGTGNALNVQSTDDKDSEGSGLTYTFSGGADMGELAINSNNGQISFNSTPDYESPDDANNDNVYEVQVTVTDSDGEIDIKDIQIWVTNDQVDNCTPTSTTAISNDFNASTGVGCNAFLAGSSAGGRISAYNTGSSLFINNPSCTQVYSTTISVQPNTTYTLSLRAANVHGYYAGGCNGGEPQAQFIARINGATVIGQSQPPIQVWQLYTNTWNSGASTTANITVNLASSTSTCNDFGLDALVLSGSTCVVASADPVISGGNNVNITMNENNTFVADVNASDEEDGPENNMTYSLSTDDAALFEIDESGNLSFITAPDFEIPTDIGLNNVYEVRVTITDSNGNTDTQNYDITIEDSIDPPTITSALTVSFPDGGTGVALDVESIDNVDSEATNTLSYSLIGTDAALFTIDPLNGQITFNSTPDAANPADDNMDNIYQLYVIVCDTENACTCKAVSITVVPDSDGDTILDDEDLDDDNDGILDIYEMSCNAQAYAESATETAGVIGSKNH